MTEQLKENGDVRSSGDREKTALVTGGSRGLGRGVVEALVARGIQVVAVARDPARLATLARETGVKTVAADVSDELIAARLMNDVRPNLLVLCAGATPLMRPLHLHSWRSFSDVWETDTKATFAFVREAMLLPLAPGSHVIVVSSGAALQGSPLSGGYAAAKRAQWFIADYAAKESARLGLALRFHCLFPSLSPSTELGMTAIAAYAARQGVSTATSLERMASPLTPAMLGRAVVELYEEPARFPRLGYRVGGQGLSEDLERAEAQPTVAGR
jgi:NAD(P)-dependent dehydrogenase (short-subunit alcohol dehydrogenase family)